MNDIIYKNQLNALYSLIRINKIGVVKILNKYQYRSSVNDSQDDIFKTLINGIKDNEKLTADIILLMQTTISNNVSNLLGNEDSGQQSSQIISAALQGIGMITSTW